LTIRKSLCLVPAVRVIADGGLAGIPAGCRLRDVAAFGSPDWGRSRRGKRGPGLASLAARVPAPPGGEAGARWPDAGETGHTAGDRRRNRRHVGGPGEREPNDGCRSAAAAARVR